MHTHKQLSYTDLAEKLNSMSVPMHLRERILSGQCTFTNGPSETVYALSGSPAAMMRTKVASAPARTASRRDEDEDDEREKREAQERFRKTPSHDAAEWHKQYQQKQAADAEKTSQVRARGDRLISHIFDDQPGEDELDLLSCEAPSTSAPRSTAAPVAYSKLAEHIFNGASDIEDDLA